MVGHLPAPTKVPAPLNVDGLTFSFDGISSPVLREVEFVCESGEIYGLFGDNGSGKTTLLNVLTGFLRPERGNVLYYGATPFRHDALTVQRFRGGLARSFQVPALIGDLSVLDNLLLATRLPGESFCSLMRPFDRSCECDAIARAEAALEEFGLVDLRRQPAATLSYGQRRIVSVLLTLLTGSGLVLLDEPFANVHPATVELLMTLLRRETARGKTLLLVEHPPRYIIQLATTAFLLRDGRLRRVTSPDPDALQEAIYRFAYESH